MSRFLAKLTLFLLAAGLLATAATAQIIPAGEDRWVTPGDGSTFFTFPAGDVESLCGAPVSFAWNRSLRLVGVPDSGQDWDTVVTRLKDADLSSGSATIPIQVTRLAFRSIALQSTPCGRLNWTVKAEDGQPVTKMSIAQTSARGGVFKANISVRVVFSASTEDGAFVGNLFYTMDLPDKTGVPWSYDPFGGFRPGIDESENCFDVLREKATTLPARHTYFIENLIAQGKCTKHG